MEDYGLSVVSPAGEGPVRLAEALLWCRAPEDEDTTLVQGLLRAALERAEAVSGRRFGTQTLALTLPHFPAWEIILPHGPVASITSISYLDLSGAIATVDAANYELSTGRDPAILQPAYGAYWPPAMHGPNSVQITYVAGYPTTQAVPEAVKQGMKLYCAHFYTQRGDDNPARTEKMLAAIDALFRQAGNGSY